MVRQMFETTSLLSKHSKAIVLVGSIPFDIGCSLPVDRAATQVFALSVFAGGMLKWRTKNVHSPDERHGWHESLNTD